MNGAAFLRCLRCRGTLDLDAGCVACPVCARAGQTGLLAVDYDYPAIGRRLDGAFWDRRGRSLWHYAPLLPAGSAGVAISLGEGNTPLVPSRSLGPALGMARLFFKNETTNPTWAHKDRFHAVSMAMARALGYKVAVTSSTGNHGASAAAYAGVAGMTALVLCPPQVSSLLLALIQTYGGRVVVTDWDVHDALGRHLVSERGWFPATGLDPAVAFGPNPYGIEGFKTIAYEIVRDLAGPPASVFVPCAGGDTFSGIWKGFIELRELGVIDRLPRMYGCQPAGADALARTLASGGEPVVLDEPDSIATSVRERTVGALAVSVVRESGGGAPTATDEEILGAGSALGREGLCVEPASALPVACVQRLVAAGQLDPDETTVCLVTAAGIKWPDVLARTTAPPPVIAPTVAALERHLTAVGLL